MTFNSTSSGTMGTDACNKDEEREKQLLGGRGMKKVFENIEEP